jgi:hypothetical protein
MLVLRDKKLAPSVTWWGSAWEIHPITRIEVFGNGMWREIR